MGKKRGKTITIRIKAKNRGKYTAHVNSVHGGNMRAAIPIDRRSSNPILKRRAVFAGNAAHWKHK